MHCQAKPRTSISLAVRSFESGMVGEDRVDGVLGWGVLIWVWPTRTRCGEWYDERDGDRGADALFKCCYESLQSGVRTRGEVAVDGVL